MKKVLFSFFAFLFVMIFAGCGTQTAEENNTTDQFVVASTIFPLHSLVEEVGGEYVESLLILPPGASPHTYDVTPKQMKEIAKADILFTIGAGVDDWVLDIVPEGVSIIDMSQYVDLLPFEDHEEELDDHGEENGHHDHGDIDPHYWLSPANAEKMAEHIAIELGIRDSERRDVYQDRAFAFQQDIALKEIEWQEAINKLVQKEVVVFHGAWNYFADYFAVDIVAVFEEFPGKTPTAQDIKELGEQVDAHQVKALFVEPQLSGEAVETIANDLNVSVGVLDPLGGLDGRESYIDLMEYNVYQLIHTLQ
ncbi:metal ABC transporter substrate-binding protein [Patescibacteria group bacterium]|nr:metal ABC transporter substrate-binding protein [Patescibacteria group bacterium]MBU1722143.1 metal ABC transporter substrate-binding protein [Patescibacteria group bacterium]MBU1901192.1 metal ABC transporter substrate-binding protein [Patescibacteria group bacterium]